jgi:hypothetical protein
VSQQKSASTKIAQRSHQSIQVVLAPCRAQEMRTALFIASLASMGASQEVKTVMITSDAPESAVQHAVGE